MLNLARVSLSGAVTAVVLALPQIAMAHDPHADLRIVTSFTINSMNPWQDGYWMQEFGQAELLMKFNEDGNHHPWLLSSLENPEPNRWVLTLRDELHFQNGRPVDAAAVLAAIDAAIDHSPAAQGSVPDGAEFTVTGALELTVTTPAPWPELPGVLADEQVFLILDADAVAAVGEDWAQLVGAGIYTGPYSVTGLDDTRLKAEAFADYWQGTPALPGLTVAFVPDPNARILAVQNNEADIALYPPLAARPAVDAMPDVHFNLGGLSTGGFTGYMNLEQGPLADVSVRKAVLRAVDYREIAQDVFRGGLAQAHSLYAENLPFALQNYQTDLLDAAALLDAAGWVTGPDGIRHKDGRKLSVILAIYPQQPDLVPLSTAVQAQLARVGIDAEIVSFDGINQALLEPSNRWDLAMVSTGAASWGRVQNFLNTYLLPGARRNYGGYDNAEVNALVPELATEVDPERRTEILHRIQSILWDEDPYAFSFNIHLGRVIVNDQYACYAPGFALYHVSWQTAPCD
ncbi:ABC transporter substrate-binding protein [Roseinatronobacter sp. S2]|uniref:ABC transporter substrate-binding protein n=1 Tax=Roseinatronobacter sp. S2 TaxID=3035471 RepID=UPI00240EAFBF|nr:ABC transporter substrate-binding protein [Roseinatronobacter sp. S2]WFE77053.1 ABC transporter substrate-binding protein [Roseinatronobacter sp. S2]